MWLLRISESCLTGELAWVAGNPRRSMSWPAAGGQASAGGLTPYSVLVQCRTWDLLSTKQRSPEGAKGRKVGKIELGSQDPSFFWGSRQKPRSIKSRGSTGWIYRHSGFCGHFQFVGCLGGMGRSNMAARVQAQPPNPGVGSMTCCPTSLNGGSKVYIHFLLDWLKEWDH